MKTSIMIVTPTMRSSRNASGTVAASMQRWPASTSKLVWNACWLCVWAAPLCQWSVFHAVERHVRFAVAVSPAAGSPCGSQPAPYSCSICQCSQPLTVALSVSGLHACRLVIQDQSKVQCSILSLTGWSHFCSSSHVLFGQLDANVCMRTGMIVTPKFGQRTGIYIALK
jgi:hypothetical protein